MDDERKFFRVVRDRWDLPLPDPLEHGYSDEYEFRQAVRRLLELWHDRVGESVGKRHDFLLIRFHDTPGGRPDEAWIPVYLLQPCGKPDYLMEEKEPDEDDEIMCELERIHGFD